MNFLDLLNNGLEVFKGTSIGKCIVSFIYLFILLIVSIKPAKNFFDDMKKSRVKKLEMVLSEGKEYLADHTKQFLKVNLEEAYFKLATGLYLGKGFQNAMMELYSQNNCNVSFDHFKRALEYMKYDEGTNKITHVKIDIFKTIIGLLFAFVGFSLLFMDSVLFVKIIMSGGSPDNKLTLLESWLSFITYFIIMFIWMIVALIMIAKPYFIYKSCKLVQSKINSNETVCFYQKAPEQIGFRKEFLKCLKEYLEFLKKAKNETEDAYSKRLNQLRNKTEDEYSKRLKQSQKQKHKLDKQHSELLKKRVSYLKESLNKKTNQKYSELLEKYLKNIEKKEKNRLYKWYGLRRTWIRCLLYLLIIGGSLGLVIYPFLSEFQK